MEPSWQTGVAVLLVLGVLVGAVFVVGTGGALAQDENSSDDRVTKQVEGNETIPISERSELPDRLSGHSVRIENKGSSEQVIGLNLSNGVYEVPVFNETISFAPNATLTIDLFEPANYSGVVRTGSDEVAFEQPPFTCNGLQTRAEVFENGTIELGAVGSGAGCTGSPVPNSSDDPGPVGEASNPPADPDGDGLFEDVNGDGERDVLDVQLLFTEFDGEADDLEFDFNTDGTVNIIDVQALFAQVV
jgi:hypothetical protein